MIFPVVFILVNIVALFVFVPIHPLLIGSLAVSWLLGTIVSLIIIAERCTR